MKLRPNRFLLAQVFAAACLSLSGHSATFIWDVDLDGVGFGGVGTWDVTTANWRDGTTVGALVSWPTAGTDNDALFGYTGGIVTLAAAVTANDLTFLNSNILFTLKGATTGGSILTLNGATPTITTFEGIATPLIGSNTALNIAGSAGLTKDGAGAAMLNGSVVNTFTGGLTIQNGMLSLNLAYLATPTNLINSGNALTLAGGTLELLGKSNVTSSQTFNGLILNSGASSLIATRGGTTGPMNVVLQGITRNTGAVLNVTLPAAGTISSSSGLSNGILGPWATVGTGTSTKYLTLTSGNFAALTGTSAATNASLTDTTGTVNYELVAATGDPAAEISANTILYAGGTGTTAPGATGFTVNGLMNVGTGVWTIGTNALTIGAAKDLVVNTANNGITISSSINNHSSGASSLTKAGTNTLILGGSNTYTGTTTLSAGTLSVATAGNLGASGASLVFSGGTLQITGTALTSITSLGRSAVTFSSGKAVGFDIADAGNVFTVGQALNQGSGSLTKLGAGTLVLNQSNSYFGSTTVSAGTLEISGSGNIGGGDYPGRITIATGATLLYNSSATQSLSNDIELDGTFEIAGGKVNLSKVYNNPFLSSGTGNILVRDGGILNAHYAASSTTTYNAVTLQNGGIMSETATNTSGYGSFSYGAGGTLTGLGLNNQVTASVGIANSKILTLSTPGSGDRLAFSNVIGLGTYGSGGSLVKTGDGIVTFTGANIYTGGSTVNGGTLVVNNSSGSGTGTGAVTVNSSATLTGTGTITGAVTINSGGKFVGTGVHSGVTTIAAGGILAPGNSVGTLTVGSLNLTSGSTAVYEFNATPLNDLTIVTTSGGLTINGGAFTLLAENTNTQATLTVGNPYNLIQYGGAIGGVGVSALAVANPVDGSGYVFGTSGGYVTLTRTAGKTWDSEGSDSNWMSASNWSSNVAPIAGEILVFGSGAKTAPVNNFTAGTSFGGIVFNASNAAGFTLSGNAINLTGAVSNNGGPANTINMNLALQAGAGVFSTLSDLTVGGIISGSQALTKHGSGKLTLSAFNTYTGATNISLGTLELSGSGQLGSSGSYAGAIANHGNLLVNSSANQTLSGVISGSGTLTKSDSGSLTLSAANTYSGGTTLNGGTVSITNTGFGSGEVLINSVVTVDFAHTGTVILANNFSGDGAITKSGSGDVRLTGDNSAFTGTVTHSNGILRLYGANAGSASADWIINGPTGQLAAGSTSTTYKLGSLAGTGDLVYNSGNGTGVTWEIGGNDASTIFSGVIAIGSGSPGINKVGTGTLTLSGANAYNGGTTVTGGTLEIGVAGKLGAGSYAGAISLASGATLKVNSTADQIFSGAISGAGALVKNNSGTLSLTGASSNSYSGGTTVTAGTLVATKGSALGTNSGLTLNGGVLAYRPTAAGALNLGSGVLNLAVGSRIGTALGGTLSQSAITSSGAAVTSAGTVTIDIWGIPGVAPAVGIHNLLTASGGLNNATYTLGNVYLYNATNFTISGLISSATAVKTTVASATALSNAYWKGAFSGGGGVWGISNGSTASNWASNQAGTVTSLVPGAGATVIFSATGASNQDAMTLGVNMSIAGIVVNDSTAVNLNADGNTLALGTGGITVNSGAGAATLGSVITLAGAQTWSNHSGSTLTVSGNVANGGYTLSSGGSGNTALSGILSGTGGLTKTDAGTFTLSGINTYTGTTTVNGGTLKITGTGKLGNSTKAVSIASGATLLYDNAADQTLTSGTATLLTVNGTLKIVGTTVNLGVSNSFNDGSGKIEIGTGGVLSSSAYANTILEPVFMENGGKMSGTTANTTFANFHFNDGLLITASGSGNTIDAHTVTINGTGTLTLATPETGDSLAVSSIIGKTGYTTGSLTKTGDGTVTLSGANIYTGTTTLSGGTLSISGASGAIQASSGVILNGGTLKLDNSTNNTNRLNDTGTVTMSGGMLDFFHTAAAVNYSESTGALSVVAGSNTIRTSQAASTKTSTLTFASLARTAGGMVDFSGTGLGVSARNKIMITANPTVTNGIIGGWATYNGNGWATYSASLGVIEYASYVDMTRQSSGSKEIVNNAANNVRIVEGTGGSAANLTLTANATINSLVQSTSGGSNAATIDTQGHTLRLAAAGGILTQTGAGALTIGTGVSVGALSAGGVDNTAGEMIVTSNASVVVNAAIIDNGSGVVRITKGGTATLTLAGSNTYTGDTAIVAGSLEIGGGGTLGNGSYAGGVSLASGTTLNVNSTAAQTLSGAITGAGTLMKDNTGTLTLTTANSYMGMTTVNQGKLLVSGSIGASAVTVSGAGTVLASGATGTIGKTLTVDNGAIVAAGDAGVAGTATVLGAATFNNGSIFSWDINGAGTGYDKLIATGVAGEVTEGNAIFRIVVEDTAFPGPFWTQTQTWDAIFTQTGGSVITNWADLFSLNVVNSSFTSITPTQGSFSISGNTLTWTAVPEPSSALAGILLGAGLLRRRRRNAA